jgi:hypothetical protein
VVASELLRKPPAHTSQALAASMSSTPEKLQGSMQSKSNTKADDMVVQVQSPDGDEAHMDREGADAQAQGLGYEFEVKEQDRWLPIANGAYTLPCPRLLFDLRRALSHLHVDASLLDASVFSNRGVQTQSEPLRAAAYLSSPPPCSERHVVLVSTFLRFPTTNSPQDHRQQCHCLRR